MMFGQLARIPVQRAGLAALVAAVLVTGVVAAKPGSGSCPARRNQCSGNGIVRWSQPLSGSWIAQNGIGGTVFGQAGVAGEVGQASVSAGHGTAVIGYGLTVSAYDLTTGFPRWSQTLTGLPSGSAVVSVRAWPGVVTVGVNAGPGVGAARRELVLNGRTGKQMRVYRAASEGAVYADLRRTAIAGATSVTSYINATGGAVWRDPTGPAGQAWRVAGDEMYMTVSASGSVGTAPVTAIRQIDLRTGDERLIQPPARSFVGTLSAVTGGSLVFSSSSGLRMYRVASARLTGQRSNAVAEWADPVQDVLYADIAGVLTGIDPVTGRNKPTEPLVLPAGTYGVSAGVAFGLTPGASGAAWAYGLARQRMLWTAKMLPFPHYFADLSGLGGSADPSTGMVLLVTCAATGQPVRRTVVGGGGRACLRPRLVGIGPWGIRS